MRILLKLKAKLLSGKYNYRAKDHKSTTGHFYTAKLLSNFTWTSFEFSCYQNMPIGSFRVVENFAPPMTNATHSFCLEICFQ